MLIAPDRQEGPCIEGQEYPKWCVIARRPKLHGPVYFYPSYCTRKGRPWCRVTVDEDGSYVPWSSLTFFAAKEVAILQAIDAHESGHTGQ